MMLVNFGIFDHEQYFQGPKLKLFENCVSSGRLGNPVQWGTQNCVNPGRLGNPVQGDTQNCVTHWKPLLRNQCLPGTRPRGTSQTNTVPA